MTKLAQSKWQRRSCRAHSQHCDKAGPSVMARSPLLADLVTFFVRILNTEGLGMYQYHPQRVVAKNANPGRNPTTDAAIIHLIWKGLCNSHYRSDVLYEYKPVIHPDVEKVKSAFLIELYLQAHYTMCTSKPQKKLSNHMMYKHP